MASCSDGPSSSVAIAAPSTAAMAPSSSAAVAEQLDQYDFANAKESDTLNANPEGGTGNAEEGDVEANCLEDHCKFKPPTPCPPVVDLRGREVIFAIAVFFLFSVSIGLIVILATSKLADTHPSGSGGAGHQSGGRPPDEAAGTGLCLSKACLQRAAYMMDTMDTAADPCADFWQYSCGGWLARATIPPLNKAWSVDHEIDRRIKHDLRRRVEAPIENGAAVDTVERKVKLLYQKCMDVDAIEELGNNPLMEIINSMGGWAVNGNPFAEQRRAQREFLRAQRRAARNARRREAAARRRQELRDQAAARAQEEEEEEVEVTYEGQEVEVDQEQPEHYEASTEEVIVAPAEEEPQEADDMPQEPGGGQEEDYEALREEEGDAPQVPADQVPTIARVHVRMASDWNLAEKSGLWNFQTALERLHFTYWRDSFFVIWVGPDHKRSDTNIIQIDQSGIGLESPSYYFQNSSDPMIVNYKKYMERISRLFGASEESAKEFADTTFNFEKKIAEIMVPVESESRRDPAAMYNPVTLGELRKLAPRINWLRFFRRNFTDVTNSTVVVVTNKDYMTNMSKLIKASNPKTLNNYLMWRLVSNFANILSKPFRKAALAFENWGKAPIQEQERWRSCLDVLDEWLGMAVGSLYIKENFPTMNRDEVIEIIGNVRDHFKKRLAEIDWMDEETRKHAIEKVRRMVYKIGFPEFLTNDTKVKKYYENFRIEEDDTFFQANLNGIHYEIKKMVDKLRESPSDEDWEMNPHQVNAYYAATENQMVFPAGILQLPYYNAGVPRYVNYGSIGSTIGHEMIHGFDVFGGLYDASGNLNRWWSNFSWKNFEDRTSCIANFYSSFTIGGFPINGNITLGENIADIGGITQAYKAYKDLEKEIGKEESLPGLDLTNDQVFFLAYGQNWCIKRTPESLRDVTLGNPHAPGQVRVNGTLSQVPQFAEAFKCKSTTPMVPETRCTVW